MTQPIDQLTQILTTGYTKSFGKTSLSIRDSLSFAEPSFGDFSSNIALVSAQKLSKKPEQIAQVLAAELKKASIVQEAGVAKPGFINLRLKPDFWAGYLESIDQNFLSSDSGKNRSVQLEFISANPTGPLTLANVWGGFYGDILANIFASQGYRVKREYYVNNIGLQMVIFGRSLQQVLGKKFPAAQKSELYPGGYIKDVAEKIRLEFGDSQRVTEADPLVVGQKGADIILESFIKPELDSLKISFDNFFYESDLDNSQTLKLLTSKKLIKEYDGAVWLDGAKIGLEKDEVLVRSDTGQGTYFLSDVTYQLDKLESRGIERAICVLGPDHHGHAKRLLKTVSFLGHDNLKVLNTQTVKLIRVGKEVKMSKRAGSYVSVEDLIGEIPIDLIRFWFASRDINNHLDFDLNLAAEESKNNPIYYIMYAYARAHSILARAKEQKITKAALINHNLSTKEIEIAKNIAKLSITITEVTTNFKVYTMFEQAIEVARSFHDYYETEKVISSNKMLTESKLYLIDQFIRLYDLFFKLIGITPIEKM